MWRGMEVNEEQDTMNYSGIAWELLEIQENVEADVACNSNKHNEMKLLSLRKFL